MSVHSPPVFPQGVLWLQLKPICPAGRWDPPGEDKGLVS